jgi:hypothetical protein
VRQELYRPASLLFFSTQTPELVGHWACCSVCLLEEETSRPEELQLAAFAVASELEWQQQLELE